MKVTVRATRAYLAGFGTSGSLLAGAALLFVLGSAIVAFRGWPQIATGPATVSVTAAHPVASSRVSRRLAAVLSRGRATGGAPLAPPPARHAAHTRGNRGVAGGQAPVSSRGAPVSRGGSSATAATAGQVGVSRPATCASGCHPAGPRSLVSQLTSTVSQAVSNIGAEVGSGVSSTTSTAAGPASGVNPQAGGVVQNAGASAGSTVSGASTTAGNVINQAGNTLSGGR